MPHDVFISYPHEEQVTAYAACAALESTGIRCWIAPRDMVLAKDWASSLIDAIDSCRVVVVIFSDHTNRSNQVGREVQQAFERNKPFVPFRIESVTPTSSLLHYMGATHFIDALTPPIESHLIDLAHTVRALLQRDPAELTPGELRRKDWQRAVEARGAMQVGGREADAGAEAKQRTPPPHVFGTFAVRSETQARSVKIVISYRRKDSQSTTRAIFERLEREFGSESVFMDVTIPVGIDFRKHINEVLNGCDVLIAVIGPKWLGRRMLGKSRIVEEEDWVRLEIETAMQRKITIIPVLVDGASMPSKAELPPGIRDLVYRNAARVDTGRDFSAHMADLINGTRRVLEQSHQVEH